MAKAKKFGALSGVFTPSILTILGVIMYLRLPWIVGQAGLWATIGIILVAHVISFTTSLSVSSIATDKKVETGGSYYIISRTLGLPIGGTLGIALFVGLSFSVSLYLIGFAEVFLGYFGFEVTLNNIRIAGASILLLLTILTFISTSLAIKSQYIILTILALSLASIFIGNHEYTPTQPLVEPFGDALPWIALFAIFFPAVTGFEAGVSMSGDLKDPRRTIPLGTISAVLVGLIVYIFLAFFFSHTVERSLLVNDPSILFQISWIPQLVVAGILGATLSSALGSILGAPRIMQAVAMDRIVPSILAKGYGPSNEPRNALVFTFIIALSGILIGELNAIARIVSIFFIITYGFLNITYAIESWAGSDFRPSFKIPRIVSIIGALACIVVMIQLDILAMIAASLALMGIFLYLKKKELTLQTGDTWNGVWSSVVKTGLRKLSVASEITRNWRPNVILFSGGTQTRPHLLEMGRNLVGKLGIFTNFELIEADDEENIISRRDRVIVSPNPDTKETITRRHTCNTIYEGINTISRVYGFSGFEPNTILMGWGKKTRNPEAFLDMLRTLAKLDYNISLLSYNTNRGYGNRKTIDIWWSGAGRNISFALTLMQFVTSAFEWRTARIRLLSISPNVVLADKHQELLQQLLDNYRITAKVKIINNSAEQLPEWQVMQNESAETDLVVMELPELDSSCLSTTNRLIEKLPTTLLIKSSSTFDEVTVKDQNTSEPNDTTEPDPESTLSIVDSIRYSQKEIVANEINNIAQSIETVAKRFQTDALNSILTLSNDSYSELASMVEKTLDSLERALSLNTKEDTLEELLHLTNDLSFHAQKTIDSIAKNLIPEQSRILKEETDRYIAALESNLKAIPTRIRMKYHWREFKRLKATSFATALFKVGRTLAARISGRPAVYNVNVERPARYYLFHKRIRAIEALFSGITTNSLDSLARTRRLLSDLYELTERTRRMVADGDNMSTSLEQERSQMLEAAETISGTCPRFLKSQSNTLRSKLLSDLQSLNNLLERPGSNFLSKPFAKAYHNDANRLALLEEFPATWRTNMESFMRRVYLDFLFVYYRHRIDGKIRKYRFDFNTHLTTSICSPLRSLIKKLEECNKQTNGKQEKPSPKKFEPIEVDTFYEPLFDDIQELISQLPSTLSIAADGLPDNPGKVTFSGVPLHEVSVRKIAGYSIATDLIDRSKEQCAQATTAINRVLGSIKDTVRLINFNLFEENDDETQTDEQRKQLATDFIGKLAQEESSIANISLELERTFNEGLSNAFAPLTSAAIVRSSGSIKKRVRDAGSRKLINRLKAWYTQATDRIRSQLVNILYSKSESQLWMGSLKQPQSHAEPQNEKVFAYLDAYAPKTAIIQQLPFYYSKLFIGQSGIGEDFWVGMEQELNQANTAIERYKNGRSGCLIITGDRNSGKSSLSRYAALSNFEADRVHNIRAPKSGNANPDLLGQSIMAAIGQHNANPLQMVSALAGHVFIIHDLELWWERRANGTNAIDMLMELIRRCGPRTLFIINLNSFALNTISNLTNLRAWALTVVECQGFDARELQEMVMLRHNAGGMKFYLGRKDETSMTAWDYARLFNRYFDITHGNPGIALNLWLASVKKISGRTLYMQKPKLPDTSFLNNLSHQQLICLLQFVLHLRCSANRMAVILQADMESTHLLIQNLTQSGLLREKFPGVFTIDSALHIPLIERMIKLGML